MAKLIQKQTLLDYVGDDGEAALFMAAIDDSSTSLPLRVLVPMSMLEEFERPEQVTILIQPGKSFADLDRAFQTPPVE